MYQAIGFIEQHGLLLLFLSVLVARVGLPLPVIPILMTAGALAGRNPEQLTEIVLVSVGASLVAELGLYWFGLRYGQHFLGWLCKMSFSPDFCVRQTGAVAAQCRCRQTGARAITLRSSSGRHGRY